MSLSQFPKIMQHPNSNDLKLYQQIPCQAVNFYNYPKTKDDSEL